jgi:hypothetical protein
MVATIAAFFFGTTREGGEVRKADIKFALCPPTSAQHLGDEPRKYSAARF